METSAFSISSHPGEQMIRAASESSISGHQAVKLVSMPRTRCMRWRIPSRSAMTSREESHDGRGNVKDSRASNPEKRKTARQLEAETMGRIGRNSASAKS